jgi:CheY-like chemotaxis protein
MIDRDQAHLPVLLIAEDDFPALESATEMCRDLGFEVHGAAHGRDVLTLLEAYPQITLLIADVHMPAMSCAELVRAALDLRPALKIVLATDAVTLELPSGLPVIHKPYAPETVLSAVMQQNGVREVGASR